MDREKTISQQVIKRMPRYYRHLANLLDEKIERVSSMELAQLMNITASQVRQDLNNFGCFGQQGYGYSVQVLHDSISGILGLGASYDMIIIGGGNMGSALANYKGFSSLGFMVRAIFDKSASTIGKFVGGCTVRDISYLEEYAANNPIDIAVLSLRARNYEDIAQRVFAINGIKAVWNLTTTELRPPEGVIVENVHLSDSLMMLSYALQKPTD